MLALTVLFAAASAYFQWRGPNPADPPVVREVTAHPIGGLILIAGLFIVAGLLNSAPLLGRLLPKKKAPPEIDKHADNAWCDKMAADDAKHMRDRIWWVWDDPQATYRVDGGDPYITFRVTFVNATIFRLTTLSTIEGETFYGRDPLGNGPRIMNQELLPLILNHGARVSLRVRQPLTRDVAFRLSEQKGRVTLDFNRVGVDFNVDRPEGTPGPEVFRLNGTDVTVANRD